MDPCLIAKLELEELQTKQWDCKLMFKPSLDDSIPEVDLLNCINHPVGISNITASPPATMVMKTGKEPNLTYKTVATNVDSN
jgi:hypothetical protein